jgi:molybdopterin-containing oxidoreductase family iron-sulfur binding subunit
MNAPQGRLPEVKANSAAERIEQLVELRLAKTDSRRGFLKAAAGTAAAAASGCVETSFEDHFRKHYLQLSDSDKQRIFERIEQAVLARTGVRVAVSDPQPLEGVEFVHALDLSQCNGNRRCVEACARENNLPDDIRYIRVIEIDAGTLDMGTGDHYYNAETVPSPGKNYLPIQCQHCKEPPCVDACPVSATWAEPDGIVVVDYDWCIGCRYCMAACPYFARRFNFKQPEISPDRINPEQGYLSNRLRPNGVVEKCTYCLHRTRSGRYPACLEACPTGARKFGNINDPKSEVRTLLERRRSYVLKEELGTIPRFFYFF